MFTVVLEQNTKPTNRNPLKKRYNLTQGTTTQTFGTANISYASHPFVVAGGAGTTDAGVVGLRVTGTRIQDDGTRTVGYADTIITDITSL